jgi:prepilin-type N-terminal cleavage/methylation domain-containing protein
MRVKTNKGFSLLELLIVVAIILIIATIAIPSLLRSRQSANESSAVTNLRTLNTAQVTYSSTAGGYGEMSDLIAEELIDSRFDGETFSGYTYELEVSAGGADYTAYANAASSNMGRYDFFTEPDFVIRYSSDAARAPDGRAGQPVQ